MNTNERQRRRSAFLVGLGAGIAISTAGWWAIGNLYGQSFGEATAKAYFTAIAEGHLNAAEGMATGQALASLRMNTARQSILPTKMLATRIVPEEVGSGVAVYGVALETGGVLPTVAQYQVLVVHTPSGARVADVWQGATPTDFGGIATASGMLATARGWLAHDAAGNFHASLSDLAGGALTSAEQTGSSGTAWARTVKIASPSWQVLGTDGGWGAVEGRWRAVTPAGATPVDLVLLGQMVDGRWRITRVVTIT